MSTLTIDNDPVQYAAYLAIDWADQKHAYALQAHGQTKKETGILENKPEVIGPWLAKLRERFNGLIAVAVEQSRGPLIHALMSYDFVVIYPLHPLTVARFREAFKFSGAKSDPLDTEQILEIVTKHWGQLRPLNPDTEPTRLLSRLVEDRRKMVGQRTSFIEALGACLKEYFPQAIEVLSGNLSTRLACDFLQKWSTFESFQHAKASTIKKFFYGHNVRSPKHIEKIVQLAQMAQPLTTDAAIVESGSRLARSYAELISNLNLIIEQYDERIKEVFNAHPEACLFNKLPGAGPVMAPRLCALFGTDRSRYESAQSLQSFTGVAPTTRTSGKSHSVYMRKACPKFQRQTVHEFARLSVYKSQWAANYVQYHTEKGKSYHTIIRSLAFKWLRILFRCWKNETPYNEEQYMARLAKRGSIFATLHLEET